MSSACEGAKHVQPGQRIRVMWLRDIISTDTAGAVGASNDTTVSGMLIPAGTIYDGTVSKVSSDGIFEILLAYERVIILYSDDPAIAIAVLTEFALHRG